MKTIILTANTAWYLWNFRENTIRSLLSFGHRVICLAKEDKYCKHLQAIGAEFRPIEISQYGVNPLYEFKSLLQIRRQLRSINPDLVYSFTTKCNLYFGMLSSKRRYQFVPNISGLGQIFNYNSTKKLPILMAYRIMASNSRKIYFQNNQDVVLFKQLNLLKNSTYKRINGSGVDTNKFTFSSEDKNYKNGAIKFILIARLLEEKGVKEYIESAKQIKAQHPNAEFFIAGPYVNNIKNSITKEYIEDNHELGVISYLGTVDNVNTLLKDKHCMVLPSYYNEGVPKSLIEGLASGLAIITTDNRGCLDTVEEGKNGFIVPIKDVESLTQAICKYIELNEAEKQRLSEYSRSIALDKFNEKAIINEYLSTANEA